MSSYLIHLPYYPTAIYNFDFKQVRYSCNTILPAVKTWTHIFLPHTGASALTITLFNIGVVLLKYPINSGLALAKLY